ncbi:hypothetical protein A9Z42_0044810 [Trichoderma parareesei]|uniref:Nudix hydrolase domain-containing protein n=1 Tax=Trichoderma parareesei TaxID=858221 RepID=A0A2H2ZVD8_TRIPA|nr:hypothetical protein A9Z42_0044810 [Trichoderma parareesei]
MSSQPYPYTHSPSLSPLSTLSPQSLSTTSDPPIAHPMTSVLILRQQPHQPPSQSHPQQGTTITITTTQPPSIPPPQILLLRRSPTDSYPLKWETPGGSVDPTDPSILSAAARELHEEASLSNPHFHATVGMARSVNAQEAAQMGEWGIPPEKEDAKDVDLQGVVGLQTMKVTTFLETGNVWGKINFITTVDEGVSERVVTDPEEHTEWGWFTEDEVRRGRAWRRVDDDDGKVEMREKVLEFTSQAVWGSILESFRVGRELGIIV